MKRIFHLIIVLSIAFGCSKNEDAPVFKWEVLNSEVTNDLNDIDFSSNNVGIACGSFGAFLKTDNEGETWQILDVGVGFSFISVFALDDNEFYTSRLGLYKTINSGGSFNEVGNLEGLGSSILDIHFFNSQVGVISKGSTIYRSTDSANSWTPVYPHGGDARILEAAGDAIYLAGGNTFDSFSRGELHKSIDNGQTWQVVDLPEEIAGFQITAIDFVDSQTGYISTFENKIFKTSNGGQDWSLKGQLNSGLVTDMTFISEDLGFLVSQNKIFATSTGGAEWTKEFETEPMNLLTAIAATPNGTIYVSGQNGNLLKRE